MLHAIYKYFLSHFSVVVSQWTKMLDIIALHLQRNGFKFDFITGRQVYSF